MCGFAGFFDSSSRASAAEMEAAAARMAARLQHRGPDDAGAWADADAGVAFGFRRLSILDLSPQGHQPMRSPSGRYVIAFNGEIYNHRAHRAELERAAQPPKFRGHSDTEVLLAAIDGWGLDRALHRCAGMFAFAAPGKRTPSSSTKSGSFISCGTGWVSDRFTMGEWAPRCFSARS